MDGALKHYMLVAFPRADFLCWSNSGMFVECAYHDLDLFDSREHSENVTRQQHFSQHAWTSNSRRYASLTCDGGTAGTTTQPYTVASKLKGTPGSLQGLQQRSLLPSVAPSLHCALRDPGNPRLDKVGSCAGPSSVCSNWPRDVFPGTIG